MTEIADFRIRDGEEDSFLDAYREAVALLRDSDGIGAVRMTRSIETPTRFVLLVEWDSVAAHEGFRASERFGQWRGMVGPFFAEPPHVEHVADV